MKKTKSLRNAIKNNVPVIDRNLMLFTDGFNNNIFDAMNVQFNKPNFNNHKWKSFLNDRIIKNKGCQLCKKSK